MSRTTPMMRGLTRFPDAVGSDRFSVLSIAVRVTRARCFSAASLITHVASLDTTSAAEKTRPSITRAPSASK